MLETLLPAALTAGASFLGSKSSSRSAANLDGKNRRWQDANWEREMRAQVGSSEFDAIQRGDYGMDQLGRHRDLVQSGQAFDQTMRQAHDWGITPQEIIGSPVPGGTQASGGNTTLGNNASQANAVRAQAQDRSADRAVQLQTEAMRNETQLKTAAIQAGAQGLGSAVQARGQDMQMTQAQMQAAVQTNIAQLQSDTNIKTSQISASAQMAAAKYAYEASIYSSDTSRFNALGQLALAEKLGAEQIAKISAETAAIKQTTAYDKVRHDERWKLVAAKMGEDNLIVALRAAAAGIDMNKALLQETLSPDEVSAYNHLIDQIKSQKGHAYETIMATGGLVGATQRFFDRSTQALQGSVQSLLGSGGTSAPSHGGRGRTH